VNDNIVLATEDSDGFMDYSYQNFCKLNGIDWCEGTPKKHILNWSSWMSSSSQQYRDTLYLKFKDTVKEWPF